MEAHSKIASNVKYFRLHDDERERKGSRNQLSAQKAIEIAPINLDRQPRDLIFGLIRLSKLRARFSCNGFHSHHRHADIY